MLFDEAFMIVQANFQGTEYTIYSNDDHLKGTHLGQDYRTSLIPLHTPSDDVDIAQRWWPFRDIDGEITYGRLFLQRLGSPTGNLKLYIYPKESGADEPDYVAGPIVTSEDIDVTGIGTSWEWVQFEFSTSFELTEDTTYFLVLKAGDITGDDVNTIQWGRGTFSGIPPWGMGNLLSQDAGSTWLEDNAYDFCFQVDEFVGRWTSRVIDVGAEDDYLSYSLYDVIQVGGGNLWEDFSPLTNTWDDIGTTSLTWGELLQLDAAGQVKQKFFWGDDLGNINKVAEKQEILTILADGCEFFKIQLTIIDPNADIFMHVTEIEQKFLT
jgi:hypothetical protein